MSEERSGHPADPSSTGASGRRAHPGCLPRLLPHGDAAVSEEGNQDVRVSPMLQLMMEKLAGIQMLDVSFPTTDGRQLVLPRHTEPSPEQALLLHHLNLVLPQQPPPRITTPASTLPCPQLKM